MPFFLAKLVVINDVLQMIIVVPKAPNFAILKNFTTTSSFVSYINQTIGGYDSFEIYCNGSKMIDVKKNGSLYTINNLRPGNVYNCRATTIFCGHTSAESKTVKECTGVLKI